MPTVLIDLPSRPAAGDPPRKHWTRLECEALAASGLLDQQRLELIEGQLISKMGKKRPHVNALTLMHAWLLEVFGPRFVNPGAPIDVSPQDNPTSEPEPGIIVLNRDIRHVTSANPRPEDLHLVVEVADTTLAFDLTTKAALYARAGIVEYWVLDVIGRRMVVHRNPQFGKYTVVMAYSEQESVAPLAAPQSEFRVSNAFVQ